MIFDLHSHILPGLDDGAAHWEESIVLARMAFEAGVRKLAATPHYLEGIYGNSRAKVLPLVQEFRGCLAGAGIEIEVLAGTEAYLSPELPDLVLRGEVATLGDGMKYVLVEFPMRELPPYAEDVLFGLQLKGVVPIIAHPERNREIARRPERLYGLIERGALAQVNAGSLMGAYGTEIREVAETLVHHRLIHFLGSDAHSAPRGYPPIREAFEWLRRIAGEEDARKIAWENPEAVAVGVAVAPFEVLPLRQGGAFRGAGKGILGKFGGLFRGRG